MIQIIDMEGSSDKALKSIPACGAGPGTEHTPVRVRSAWPSELAAIACCELAETADGQYHWGELGTGISRAERRGFVSQLASKSCVPCKGGTPPLTSQEIAPLVAQVEGWEVVEEHHLRNTFRFKDFKSALDFVNRVGAVAEQEGHHPDISFGWGRATIEIWTHKINGLTESDFVLAAKINEAVLTIPGFRPPA